ncbi:hypothetical protein QM012_003393 [Aureobasidium pullulans]|uniref:DUF7779 domain-containing protein n=1 Tax=Aureobasidium pullulans TaxID=5580 RepID=A0ABR0T8A7_AURPU
MEIPSHEHSYTIKDFYLTYEDPHQIPPIALDAIFESSFKSLDEKSSNLLGMFSFLMSDSIPLDLFNPETCEDRGENLGDLSEAIGCSSDEFEFNEALEPLITLALVARDPLTRSISVNRLVQSQYQLFMTGEQRQQSFSKAVFLVWRTFPKPDSAEAQLYKQWSACEKYIQHVLALKDAFKTKSRLFKGFKAPLDLVNLMLACERYLVESHSFVELKDVLTVSQAAIRSLDPEERSVDLECTLLSHMAILEESLGNPLQAIEIATKGHELRKTEVPPNRIILAWDESNLGYTCNTANTNLEAKAQFENARERWAAMVDDGYVDSPWPTVQKKNLGRCLVYLHAYAGAETLLLEATREFELSEPVNWAMLAYAHFAYGVVQTFRENFVEAEILFTKARDGWLEGDQTRLHPFNGGCMYRLGCVALQCGKVDAAVKHIQDSIYVTEVHRDSMPIEHGRNLLVLSQALERMTGIGSDPSRVKTLRHEAQLLLRGNYGEASSADHTDDYNKFIPIFWR